MLVVARVVRLPSRAVRQVVQVVLALAVLRLYPNLVSSGPWQLLRGLLAV